MAWTLTGAQAVRTAPLLSVGPCLASKGAPHSHRPALLPWLETSCEPPLAWTAAHEGSFAPAACRPGAARGCSSMQGRRARPTAPLIGPFPRGPQPGRALGIPTALSFPRAPCWPAPGLQGGPPTRRGPSADPSPPRLVCLPPSLRAAPGPTEGTLGPQPGGGPALPTAPLACRPLRDPL